MSFFLLVIALSVLPWFTASDYPFGVFKLFLVVFVLYIVPNVSRVHVTRSFVLYICFVDRCLSLCTFFFWSLRCLFFVLQILITPLGIFKAFLSISLNSPFLITPLVLCHVYAKQKPTKVVTKAGSDNQGRIQWGAPSLTWNPESALDNRYT